MGSASAGLHRSCCWKSLSMVSRVESGCCSNSLCLPALASVSFRDACFPVIGDAKLISSEQALAEKQLQQPLFLCCLLLLLCVNNISKCSSVEPLSLLDVGLTSCGLNFKQNKTQNKANKQTKKPIKPKNEPQTECVAGFDVL